jgi:hypothetical protein
MTIVASINPDDLRPALVFDLLSAIKESREASAEGDWDIIKNLTLYKLPNYARANLNRVILNENVSHEEARWCCIHFGVRRICASEQFKEWKKLYELATSKETIYESDGDWDDVQERLTTFKFEPHDLHAGRHTTNARIPEPIKAQVSGVAKILGKSASTIAAVCFIDALRDLDGVMHKKDMDDMMEEFYSILERRTVRLRRLLVEIGVLEPGESP